MKTPFLKLASAGILAFSVIFSACKKKKEDNPEQTNNCSKENYGVLTVDFGDPSVKHGILVTFANSGSRNKIVAKGKMSDTLHLPPGTYQINVASVNDMNQTLMDETYNNRNITQCGNVLIEVEF